MKILSLLGDGRYQRVSEKILPVFKNQYYRYASGYSFLFFISWSLWWSLYAIWLEGTIGLTGEQRGTLYAVNQFTSIIFMVGYGIIQDKLGLKKYLIWLLSITLVLTGPFIIYIYEPLLTKNFPLALAIGSVFFGIGYLAGCGLLDSFTEKMSRSFGFEYGTSRAWGSFGYAVGTAIAGLFFSINPHINFWMVSVFGLLFMVINFRFKSSEDKVDDTHKIKVTKEDFIIVFKDIKFWIFVLFITGTWSFYNIYDQQLFPVFYASLFSTKELGTQVYGYLNSFQVVLESIGMATIPFFVNKVGAKKSLLIGGIIMLCRIFVSGSSENAYLISMIKLLHAIEVPLCVLSVFKYSVSVFDERLSSTIFLVGFQIASSLGVVILSTGVGQLLDMYGYHTIFYIFSGIVCSIVIFGVFFLSRTANKTI